MHPLPPATSRVHHYYTCHTHNDSHPFFIPSDGAMPVPQHALRVRYWLLQPIGQAQGRGIFLFNKLSQVRLHRKQAKSTSCTFPHPDLARWHR